jgi:hypothetical protein
VIFPGGSLFDPATDQVDFRRSELAARIGGWHPLVLLWMSDSQIQFTRADVSRNDDGMAFRIAERASFDIQTQIGFTLSWIGTMAPVTCIGQDRPDIATEVDARIMCLALSIFRRRGQPGDA